MSNAELIATARLRGEKYSSGSDEYLINLLIDALEAAERNVGPSIEVGMRDARGIIVAWRDLDFPTALNPENWPGCTLVSRAVSAWAVVPGDEKATP